MAISSVLLWPIYFLFIRKTGKLGKCMNILIRVGPVGGSYFGIIFSTTQIICISNVRSLSLIVNIVWLFKKYTLVNVTTFVTTL